MRYFLEFSYDGSAYHGWQRQPNALSIQEVMENALGTLLKTKCSLVASGRTDTGVHARQMFAHFDTHFTLSDHEQLLYQLNQFLPQDIAVQDLREVKPEAHARFDALSRTYQYHLVSSKTAFGNSYHYRINQELDFDLMNEAAQLLLDYTDFECFSKTKTDVKTYLCDIRQAKWNKTKNGYIFTITADRFLRNMVRAIVGTLIEIGLKKKNKQDLHRIIASKNRSEAGYSVPAKALFLTNIEYPNSIFL